MKNLKKTYWILPLLAANLSMGPEMIRGWDALSLSSKAACDPAGDILRKGQMLAPADRKLITATCEFDSKTQITVGYGKDQEKFSVTGNLTVERVEEVVEIKKGRAFDMNKVSSTADDSGPKVEKVERVSYRAVLVLNSDSGVTIEPIVKTYAAGQEGRIASEMQAAFAKGIADMQNVAKKEANEKRAQETLEAEVKACIKSDDGSKTGKVNTLAEKMTCHKNELITLTGKEAVAYYDKNMKTVLESMVFRGNAEERGEAQAVLDSLNKGYVPSGVKNSISALNKSVAYQAKISDLAAQSQLAEQMKDKEGKADAQRKIQGLKSQMLSDMQAEMRADSIIDNAFPLGRTGVYGGNADTNRYMKLLDNNMRLAFLTPNKFFDLQDPGSQTGPSQYDLDLNGRLQRGDSMAISGLPNVQPGGPRSPLTQPGYQPQYGPRQMRTGPYGPQSMPPQQYGAAMPQQYNPRMMPQSQGGYVPQPIFRTGIRN